MVLRSIRMNGAGFAVRTAVADVVLGVLVGAVVLFLREPIGALPSTSASFVTFSLVTLAMTLPFAVAFAAASSVATRHVPVATSRPAFIARVTACLARRKYQRRDVDDRSLLFGRGALQQLSVFIERDYALLRGAPTDVDGLVKELLSLPAPTSRDGADS